MAEWIDVAEARKRDGLRLALVMGVPSPWGEAEPVAPARLRYVDPLHRRLLRHGAGGSRPRPAPAPQGPIAAPSVLGSLAPV